MANDCARASVMEQKTAVGFAYGILPEIFIFDMREVGEEKFSHICPRSLMPHDRKQH